MKHFIPPGTKWQETCDPSGVRILWKSTPEGSHVYRKFSRQGPKGTIKHFVPPGTKGYNKTFCAARDQRVQWNILCRQGPNGTMKHFVSPGTKRYNKTFYPARDQKVQWNILSRQGPKGTIKHFVPPGTKWYNKTFCTARDQKVQWNILSRQGPKGKRHVTPPGSGYCENRPRRSRMFRLISPMYMYNVA